MIVGMRHAMYAGWIMGIGIKHGVPLEPVVDPLGNYTDRLVLRMHDGDIELELTIVVPPPPDDWVLR
jgi:hypothetical protein